MRIIRRKELVDQPWKNGGGITREIAADRRDGRLVWRLSMADVASDGPFSRFDGLSRILTVVAGNGMQLISREQTLHAQYADPICFPGDWDITSKLNNGPLTDLNLIYDPALCEAAASVSKGARQVSASASTGQIALLHVLKGDASLKEGEAIAAGDTVLMQSGTIHFMSQSGADIITLMLTIKAN